MKTCIFVLIESTNVTDGRTDTAWRHRPRLCRASRDLFHLLLQITIFTQMTHNFSSPSIRQISTPTSFTYKTLCNRSLLGWLPIFSLSTLLKLDFFLLDLNNNSLKYRTALSLQPTPLATLVLFLTNPLPSRTKSLHFLNLATITSVNFAVSAHTLTSKHPAPLPPPSFIPSFITVILSIITFQTVNLTLNRLQQLQNSCSCCC